MKCYIGLGSNLGDRKKNIQLATSRLANLVASSLPSCQNALRASPLFESKALVPQGAPAEWSLPFLNAVLEIDWSGTPRDLLRALQTIEQQIGRTPGPRWSPRIIDLDLLVFGNAQFSEPDLQIPHPEMSHRRFVLDPLKHLAPTLTPPGWKQTVLARSRELKDSHPLWMGILNLTPDSFSDGGELLNESLLEKKISFWLENDISILDLGAESTRPGATAITQTEEERRLSPALKILKNKLALGSVTNIESPFRPWISVDTRSPITGAKALEFGVDILNDVSGLTDSAWFPLLKASTCQYVLMHSLSVPANPNQVLREDQDSVDQVKSWAQLKLQELTTHGISLDRVIFDPGVGFGKTPGQSLILLQRMNEFLDLPVRLMIGASRKSFMSLWSQGRPQERDSFSLGVSVQLAQRGCDILRVHEAIQHKQAFRAFKEVQS